MCVVSPSDLVTWVAPGPGQLHPQTVPRSLKIKKVLAEFQRFQSHGNKYQQSSGPEGPLVSGVFVGQQKFLLGRQFLKGTVLIENYIKTRLPR